MSLDPLNRSRPPAGPGGPDLVRHTAAGGTVAQQAPQGPAGPAALDRSPWIPAHRSSQLEHNRPVTRSGRKVTQRRGGLIKLIHLLRLVHGISRYQRVLPACCFRCRTSPSGRALSHPQGRQQATSPPSGCAVSRHKPVATAVGRRRSGHHGHRGPGRTPGPPPPPPWSTRAWPISRIHHSGASRLSPAAAPAVSARDTAPIVTVTSRSLRSD